MTVISYFFGIAIKMFFKDHSPPHFHAEYQGMNGRFSISDGSYMDGNLPSRAVKIVSEWALAHQIELTQDWDLAQRHQPLQKIPGADND